VYYPVTQKERRSDWSTVWYYGIFPLRSTFLIHVHDTKFYGHKLREMIRSSTCFPRLNKMSTLSYNWANSVSIKDAMSLSMHLPSHMIYIAFCICLKSVVLFLFFKLSYSILCWFTWYWKHITWNWQQITSY
jgi:hypothetical protein